jgi:hypothetical protein
MAASRKRLPSVPACKVCKHPDRARIEALRAGGAGLRVIAEQFGLNKDNIHYHFAHHVSRQRRAVLLAGPLKVDELLNAAAEESRSVLEYLKIARGVIFNQFLTAAEAGDRNSVSTVGGRLIDVLRELGRLTGELREVSGLTINQNTINVFGSPEFAAL